MDWAVSRWDARRSRAKSQTSSRFWSRLERLPYRGWSTSSTAAPCRPSKGPSFPERSDLIKAVVQQEVDDCAEAASTIASNAGAVRADVDAGELLLAAARLATPASEGDVAQARRMVALLLDGLRHGAGEARRIDR